MSVYKRGATYWYEFVWQGRRIREATGFTNKRAAQDAQDTRRLALLEGRAGIKRTKPLPEFAEFSKEFLEWSKANHAPKTYGLHDLNIKTLMRWFRKQCLNEITPEDVERFRIERMKESHKIIEGVTVSPATVNRALSSLKRIFNYARDVRRLAVENPVRKVQFCREPPGMCRVVTPEEEARYLANASEPLRAIATIILATGLRPDEVFRLRRADLGTNDLFVRSGKTKAARRSVSYGLVAPEGASEWVFPSPDDPTRHIGSVKKAHAAALRRAKIVPQFRLYDLRHTFATRAVASGADLPTLASILGHTTIQMTMRYVHPSEEAKRRVFERMGGGK